MRESMEYFTKDMHTEIGVMTIMVNDRNNALVSLESGNKLRINGIEYNGLSMRLTKDASGAWSKEGYLSMTRSNYQQATPAAIKKLEQVASSAMAIWEKAYVDEVREAKRISINNSIVLEQNNNKRALKQLQEIHHEIEANNKRIEKLEQEIENYESILAV